MKKIVNLFFKMIRKKISGAAVLETALTLPLLLYLVFFIIEVLKIKDVQLSVDSMAMDLALEYSSSKSTINFDTIIAKYKPAYVQKKDLSYFFCVAKNLENLFKHDSYPIGALLTDAKLDIEPNEHIDGFGTNFPSTNGEMLIKLDNYKKPESNISKNFADHNSTLQGKAFMITVVCDYKFSSPLVRILFGGGSNTAGSKFLLWGRAVNICD